MNWRTGAPMMALALGGAGGQGHAQAALPQLTYVDPPGFYRSASFPPADFSATMVNASVQVYPFRTVNFDVRQAFSRTLLRELIDPRYQESRVAPGPAIDALSVPGADLVLRVRFRDMIGGSIAERMRIVLVVGTAVAIVDAHANSPESWQRILPQFQAFAETMQIVSAASPAPRASVGTPDGRRVAGLYLGFAYKFDAIRNQSIYAAFYYLLSADGRVYRAYDDLTVPGNDPDRFDFAGARRADPVNSGQYILQGEQLVIRLGSPQQPETVIARLIPGNKFVIGKVEYERQ